MTDVLALARDALGERPGWLVGGAVRDELLGRPPATDLDLVAEGPIEPLARALARAARAAAFPLSDEFGAWRVVARDHDWQADITPLHGGDIESDLRRRDFTINAIARPLRGGELIDPLGGAGDLRAGVLRLVSAGALEDDPLRALRLVRLSCELGLAADPDAREGVRAAAGLLSRVAGERVYAELRRVLASERAGDGIRLALELGLCASVLPELEALRDTQQSRYHHLDALDHTLEVLDCAVALERDPAGAFGAEHAPAIRELLGAPLGDEMTRGTALRLGALLHDVAKPQTRTVMADGRIGFPGHDTAGVTMARAILGRLHGAERVQAHVGGLIRNHLRLGFLVHQAPLDARARYRYLDGASGVEADVTLLSVADRLATRGAGADEAIARHLELAQEVIGEALRWSNQGRPPALVRGDELARALGIEPGPLIGELLAGIAEEAYAGEVRSAQEAIAFAAARIA